MKWTVTMVTPWSTRSLSSPNASWDIICWKWVTYFPVPLWVRIGDPLLLLDPLTVSVIELCDGRALKWILSALMKHWAPAHSASDCLCHCSLWQTVFYSTEGHSLVIINILNYSCMKRNMLCYSCVFFLFVLFYLFCKGKSLFCKFNILLDYYWIQARK